VQEGPTSDVTPSSTVAPEISRESRETVSEPERDPSVVAEAPQEGHVTPGRSLEPPAWSEPPAQPIYDPRRS
jgi:hypothetical protein